MSRRSLSRFSQRPRRRPSALLRLLPVAVGIAALATACGGTNPYAPRANLNTVATTFVLFPLSAAPVGQATAVDLLNVRPVRATLTAAGAPSFDFAVDRVGGVVQLLPPKVITAGLSVPETGFQLVDTPFDALKTAPGGTYQRDSAVAVAFGRTVVVQATTTQCRSTAPIYAKLVVDSLGANGALYIRTLVDPNCGFKSLDTGLPKS